MVTLGKSDCQSILAWQLQGIPNHSLFSGIITQSTSISQPCMSLFCMSLCFDKALNLGRDVFQ